MYSSSLLTLNIMNVKFHHTSDYTTEEAITLNLKPKYWEHYQDDNSPIHIFHDKFLPLAKDINCKKKIAILSSLILI